MQILGARRAIREATGIGWSIPEFGGMRGAPAPNNLGRICTMHEASEVLDAVNRQGGAVKHWLYFAYAAQSRKEDREAVHKHVMQTIFGAGSPWLRKNRKNKLHIPEQMVELCMEDYRLRVLSRGERHLLIRDMCIAMGVDAGNWGRDWSDLFRYAEDILATLDGVGVKGVSREIDWLRWCD